jgi:hypothetical protein
MGPTICWSTESGVGWSVPPDSVGFDLGFRRRFGWTMDPPPTDCSVSAVFRGCLDLYCSCRIVARVLRAVGGVGVVGGRARHRVAAVFSL